MENPPFCFILREPYRDLQSYTVIFDSDSQMFIAQDLRWISESPSGRYAEPRRSSQRSIRNWWVDTGWFDLMTSQLALWCYLSSSLARCWGYPMPASFRCCWKKGEERSWKLHTCNAYYMQTLSCPCTPLFFLFLGCMEDEPEKQTRNLTYGKDLQHGSWSWPSSTLNSTWM